jgi:hypothetical protein
MFLRLTKDARHSARTLPHNHAFAIEQIGQDLRHGAGLPPAQRFEIRNSAQYPTITFRFQGTIDSATSYRRMALGTERICTIK